MKRVLRYMLARRARYVLALVMLTSAHGIARAIDVCGTLKKPVMCLVLAVDVEGGYEHYYYLGNYGDFDIGDYVRVIGTVVSGPSPCYVTNDGIINNTISWCNTITTWYIKPDGSGDHPTIQAGIDAAMNGDTLELANGVFSGSGNRDIDCHGKVITLQSESGDPDSCIIDCEGTGADPHRGFHFHSGEGPRTVLEGVTVANAYHRHSEGGGGVFCEGSSPTFTNCTFSGNSADFGGGGMRCDDSDPTLTNCTFSGNGDIGNPDMITVDGGGMFCDGSSPTLTNCTFSDNVAWISGAGMVCSGGSFPTLTNCTFSDNSDDGDGGGMFCLGGSSPTLTNCTFSGNSADCGGGGMRCDDSDPTLTNCTFSDNSAGFGGGMVCDGSSPTLLTNCTFSGNTARCDGGGMYCIHESSATLTSCMLLGNSAYKGGGMGCESSSPALTNCTFSGNSASGYGGGISCWNYSFPTLERTIIAFSTAREAVYCDEFSGATLTCCDVHGNAGGDWVGCIAGQNSGNGNFSADPLFCGPSGSGDYSVRSVSPCAPSNSPCGVLVGASPVGCGIVGQLVQCPNDSIVLAFSNIPSLVLEGFAITNIDTLSMAFDYYLASEGPATLVDNGDPNSLSGTTQVLPPGESFSPPEAALSIPKIREYSQEFVTYHVSAVGHPEISDSCTTVITFEPPVAIQINNFEGSVLASSVELVWDVASDEEIKGFKINRRLYGTEVNKLINSNDLIPRQTRRYIDDDVQGGRTYLYTLGVVREDGSEVRSQPAEVKTKANALALHQNHPNPFNPVTTISFTLPERVHANLSIYDIEGKLVKTLVNDAMDEGFKEVTWDGKDARGNAVSSGVYFCRLKAGKKVLTRKIVVLK